MKNGFICPKCKAPLTVSGGSLRCPDGHCYDISSGGYVNLLLSNMMNSKLPGDNKLMVNARRAFLNKGFYRSLADITAETVLRYADKPSVVLDAGCGEGYYTGIISEKLKNASVSADIFGIDISKNAVNAAAKRYKDISFAAASVFHIPMADESCDILVTMFAPYCGEEYLRVLKKGGVMIMAIPGERHLFGLKSAVYDKPYLNEVKDYPLDGFEFLGTEKLDYTIDLTSNEDISSLFMMTPYYYKTSAEGQKRLDALSSLETEVSFEVLSYRK